MLPLEKEKVTFLSCCFQAQEGGSESLWRKLNWFLVVEFP